MAQRSVFTRERSTLGGKYLLTGTLLCAAVFVLCALIAGGICYATKDPLSVLRPAALAAFLVSGAIPAFLLSKRHKDLPAVLTAIPLLIFALLLLICSLILSGGKLSLSVPMNLLCYLLVGGLFAFLGRIEAKKAKRKRGRR